MTRVFPQPVLDVLAADPGRTAIETPTRTVTREELLDLAARIAGGMRAAGLGPGTGVAMVLGLTPEAYAAHLAAHALGCRVAPARPAWGAEQLAFALTKVDVVVADLHLDVAPPSLGLNDLLTATPIDIRARGEPTSIARLIFTSGSTGRPKACAHSYRAMSLAYQSEHWPGPLCILLSQFGRCLVHQNLAAPVMFTYLGRCLIAGGVAVLPGELGLAEAIERLRITATMMLPGSLHEILESGADLSSLKALMLGGSPASPNLLRQAVARLGPILWQGYGQGEAGIISMLTPEDLASGKEMTVGRPVPDVEIELRDGEIWVRSPHMMDGYWEDPQQTLEVLRYGWLRTRDMGFVDRHGMLRLTGRTREVIMVNGEVCYVGAIEQVLASHPKVAQAFVVGVPDPLTGEAVHAFIQPVGAEPPGRESLLSLVRQHLGGNSVPVRMTAIRRIPMTEGGKPDKRAMFDEPSNIAMRA